MADGKEIRRLIEMPISNGYPFDPEAKLIWHLVPSNTPAFDVGANAGAYGLVLRDKVGPRSLYIFEPLPELRKGLVERFGEDRVFPIALSATEGTATMRLPLINEKRYSTRATLEPDLTEHEQTGVEEVDVKVTTLDAFVAEHNIHRIGFIKIDVEGHELAVLQGGAKSIKRFQPLLLVEVEQRHHTQPIQEILGMIEDWGYAGYFLDIPTLRLKALSEFSVGTDQDVERLFARDVSRYVNNFLFIPAAQAVRTVAKANRFLEQERRLVGIAANRFSE